MAEDEHCTTLSSTNCATRTMRRNSSRKRCRRWRRPRTHRSSGRRSNRTSKRRVGTSTRLEEVFASLDEKVRGKHCDGIAGIIEEGKSVMEEDFDDATMDACLIAGGQRAEHYEMAAYGSLIAWARVMEHTEAADLLQETLDEEKAADEKLSSLAEGGINQGAADAANSNGSADRKKGRCAEAGFKGRRDEADAAPVVSEEPDPPRVRLMIPLPRKETQRRGVSTSAAPPPGIFGLGRYATVGRQFAEGEPVPHEGK